MPNTHGDPRRDFFNKHAATWDAGHHGKDARQTIDRLVGLADILRFRPGDELLEVGCGTGQITAYLADCVRPGRVTAVDFSPAMLEVARRKAIDAEFMELDVCEPDGDFAAGRFDVILCFHCFPHFRDQAMALKNMAGWMKPAGRLLVVHLAGGAHINHFHANVDGPVCKDVLPTGDAWAPLLAGAGLKLRQLIDRDDLFCMEAERA